MKKQKLTQEQKNILNRCKTVFKNWIKDDFVKDCTQILLDHSVTEKAGNYADAYPIVAAVLLDNCTQILNGSAYYETVKQQKRDAHRYMKYNLRV